MKTSLRHISSPRCSRRAACGFGAQFSFLGESRSLRPSVGIVMPFVELSCKNPHRQQRAMRFPNYAHPPRSVWLWGAVFIFGRKPFTPTPSRHGHAFRVTFLQKSTPAATSFIRLCPFQHHLQKLQMSLRQPLVFMIRNLPKKQQLVSSSGLDDLQLLILNKRIHADERH
ncbi:UNVERIFIED_CONTAM: hypothetical protein ABID98_004860 [Brevibacillus sp. OAP136]